MNHKHPIFTETAECQDCYRCVRNCPVKAIKIENNAASVIPELCISCGSCVEICPVNAKKVRNDLLRVKRLLKLKERVVVSLAPSYVSEFKGISGSALIRGIQKLGFWRVSETALGAQEVSAHIAEQLKGESRGEGKIILSSACPVVVDYIARYRPELTGRITDLFSPVLAHTRMLRERLGDDIGIVFIGPCIAKKNESDRHIALLNAALTFEDLKEWFSEEGIELSDNPSDEKGVFFPEPAKEGTVYAVDGGMIASIKPDCRIDDAAFMAVSGIHNVINCLQNLEQIDGGKPVFLELLACEGGCINGPKVNKGISTVVKRQAVISRTAYGDGNFPRKPGVDISCHYSDTPVSVPVHDEEEIRRILEKTGKTRKEAEKNCGGCGYSDCRGFAQAVLEGKAETNMCITYMRQMAHKKANKLIETMPSGVVIVDQDLKIIECNRNFTRIIGEEGELVFDAQPGLNGASLEKMIHFSHMFRQVMETGVDILDKDIRMDSAILHCSIFSIEKNRVVGGVIQDITHPSIQKEEIIEKARDVIHKNLKTVQKIAYLLGENASETEISLNSIIDSFMAEKLKKK